MDAKNQAFKQSGEEDPGQAAPKGRLDSSAAKSDILARRTTGVVTAVAEGECFVFGSNEAGRHGRGAAAQARRFGARYGVGEGPAGRTYAIPTKPADLRQRLSLDRIGRSVETFVAYAASHPDCIFLVSEIGCGLAGYEPADVAPLFAGAVPLTNVFLPASFWRVLGHARPACAAKRAALGSRMSHMTSPSRSDREFLESMARIDEVGIECSLDTCGPCYYHHLMAQVARDLLAGDACVGTVQAWSDELQHRWEDGPFFRLWTEEKAAGRDPRCAFRERGWTP